MAIVTRRRAYDHVVSPTPRTRQSTMVKLEKSVETTKPKVVDKVEVDKSDKLPEKPVEMADSSDTALMAMCIGILKDRTESLTIKEMAHELSSSPLPQYREYDSLCKSSTILSTKLTSFYRRTHLSVDPHLPLDDVVAQILDSCPIVRSQSLEQPRRLVYRYASRADLEQEQLSLRSGTEALARHGTITPPIDSARNSREPSNPEDIAELKQLYVHTDDAKGLTPRTASPAASVSQRLPTPPPPVSASSPPPSPPYQLRRVIKRTPHAFTPPVKRRSVSTSDAKIKKLKEDFSPKPSLDFAPGDINLYYDSDLQTTLRTAASCALEGDAYSKAWLCEDEQIDADIDILSPEEITFDDLEQMVM